MSRLVTRCFGMVTRFRGDVDGSRDCAKRIVRHSANAPHRISIFKHDLSVLDIVSRWLNALFHFVYKCYKSDQNISEINP